MDSKVPPHSNPLILDIKLFYFQHCIWCVYDAKPS